MLGAATGAVLAERSGPLCTATNNVAEYQGLIAGLTDAAELGASEVVVHLDSQLIDRQMRGVYRVKAPRLRGFHAEAGALVARFEAVRFEWVPRERNGRADAPRQPGNRLGREP